MQQKGLQCVGHCGRVAHQVAQRTEVFKREACTGQKSDILASARRDRFDQQASEGLESDAGVRIAECAELHAGLLKHRLRRYAQFDQDGRQGRNGADPDMARG